MKKLLQTSDLAVGYRGKTIIEGLYLEAQGGEFVCFMGPNGIGKSTLVRTLAGLQAPIRGKVSYAPGVKPAVVLTDRITAAYMTVRQLVAFGRYPYLSWTLNLTQDDKRAIDAAISHVRIESIADRRLHELSDGQLQMAQIARALAQETSLILLDEPTAHLDLNNRLEITLLLRRLAHESGKSVVMATHELDLALQTADKVWLAGGVKRIVIGSPEDLVLSGTFDEIFSLKGFDLRTGKVRHSPTLPLKLAVTGDGAALLWTRNALERAGYPLVTTGADVVVEVQARPDGHHWAMNDATFQSIAELLTGLSKRLA